MAQAQRKIETAPETSEPLRMTAQEYLEFDEKSEFQWEFFNGLVVPRHGYEPGTFKAMAGASKTHVVLANRFLTALANHLAERPCEVGGSDLKVQKANDESYVLPDVVVWCEDAQWNETQPDVLLTPLVIIEILSPSTASKDRGEKLENYRQIASLTDYLIVSPQRIAIEHYARGEADGETEAWIYRHLTRRDQTVRLTGLELEIPVAELYRRLDLPEGLSLVEENENG